MKNSVKGNNSFTFSTFFSWNRKIKTSWVKVFRIIPEFRILRLTFCVKVSLKFLNSADSYGFFDLILLYLKTIDHLNFKLLIFIGILQVLRFDFQKFRILEILNFLTCILSYYPAHSMKMSPIAKLLTGLRI